MTNDTYGDDPFDEEDLTEAKIATLPECNFCGQTAHYDFKTQMGQWAFGCKADYEAYRLYDSLGTGKGQKLVVEVDSGYEGDTADTLRKIAEMDQ